MTRPKILMKVIIVISLLFLALFLLPISSAYIRTNSDPFKHGKGELVLIPGHSVLAKFPVEFDARGRPDIKWDLSEFQLKHNQGKVLTKHITDALLYAKQDPSRVVIFSGGQTHQNIGPISEGFSYYHVASAFLSANGTDQSTVEEALMNDRLVTEDFARDSFENLLFSVCRYKEWTGEYPEKITIFGFSFKKRRFVELHREAIGFPSDRFDYLHVPNDTVQELKEEIHKGELENAFNPYLADPYGCRPPLSLKREERDPYKRFHGIFGYQHACPELSLFLNKCRNQ